MGGFDFWNRLLLGQMSGGNGYGKLGENGDSAAEFPTRWHRLADFFLFSFFNSNFLAGFKGRERRNETTYVSEAWTVKAAGV